MPCSVAGNAPRFSDSCLLLPAVLFPFSFSSFPRLSFHLHFQPVMNSRLRETLFRLSASGHHADDGERRPLPYPTYPTYPTYRPYPTDPTYATHETYPTHPAHPTYAPTCPNPPAHPCRSGRLDPSYDEPWLIPNGHPGGPASPSLKPLRRLRRKRSRRGRGKKRAPSSGPI